MNLFAQLPSRKSVKKSIDKGDILVDGQRSSTGFWLKGGEIIEYQPIENTPPKPYNLRLNILFEDDHIAIINKPAGLVVSGNQFKTITNALLTNLSISKEIDALPWSLPTHRLDKSTSGLLIIAKTKKARIKIGQDFEHKRIQKEYHAVVMGKLEGKGEINLDIENKQSLTYYESIYSSESLKNKFLTLVKLEPKTGRTHQLRIHLSKQGFPILGDAIYSPKNNQLKHKGLFLSATKLSFMHPASNEEITIEIPYPNKFEKRMKSEKKRWNTYRTV